ncbi:uncharacterized protein NCU01296 [Neurospora crassa OR74A]|uniref:Derlin n=1 Tax=Neurospora crassa (strain ATCC 24698 / 74-OR23-1A / CBS 708.71 / DSM 1257 / FGSC 987) TaxID=367110 RepID=V5ILM9_NEUCR|nr:uncharacterized protein NCU01296 [Neurospora crassa OR74A]ESA42547.1 hypothetical protein, variant [Neurospora crassa OR74A]|eukprot:XP_011394503.1 uncharacterized protein NCU01296 [Neurospora crassa OR74A]
MSSEIMAAYWQAPPMARTLATAILVTSIMAYFGPLPISWIYFDESRLFKLPPELWRLVTSFLLSSPQLGIVLDPYFAYLYLSQLETSNPKFQRKEDVLWYLITVGGFIIVGLTSLFFFLFSSPLDYTFSLKPVTTHIGILGISARIVQCIQLLRFLEPRKITATSQPPIIRKIPGGLRCGHGGNALDDPSNILCVLGVVF